jgi:hypothetical protein
MGPIAGVSRRRLFGLRRDRGLDFRCRGIGLERRRLWFNRLTGSRPVETAEPVRVRASFDARLRG